MRALLLAAGLGTRLRPVTDTLPKCLVPINGVPLLEYWLDLLLTGAQIDRVLINTHYLANHVRSHVGKSKWRERVDLVHEPELLGTGGTVLTNRSYFGDAPYLVAHADNLTRFDLAAFISRHRGRPEGCDMTMMTFETDAPQLCGIVEEDGMGIVQAFHEKVAMPPGTRANGAVYLYEPSVSDFVEKLRLAKPDLSNDVIPAYLGKIATYYNSQYHRDIGSLESLRRAELEFTAEIQLS